jgi:glycerol-3-phosphate acyltransferase PlsY
MLLPILIAALVGYLLGSLPFGCIVARAKGVNIFEVGSRSPGATNVRRVLGKGPGNLVFALDVLKGALAASWALLAAAPEVLPMRWETWAGGALVGDKAVALGVAGLVGALFGHSFSCFTRFRGGKGVATSLGGLLVLMPLVVVIAFAVWAAVFLTTRYVSLASVAASLALVATAWALDKPALLFGLTIAIALFVIVRHRANIGRLLNGTEHKFCKTSRLPPSS